jgi:hypothetical protein
MKGHVSNLNVEKVLRVKEGKHMKRIGYVYEKICHIDNIKLAIKKSAKGKTKKRAVKVILDNLEYYANEIQNMLKSKTYKLSKNYTKRINDGPRNKQRIITVPKYYPDQIIHWALMIPLQEIIEKSMYYYSCGSMPNKGIHHARKYVEKVLKEKPTYALKMDIKKFFPSVSNEKMKQLFRKKIKCNDTLRLINSIIDNGGEGLPIGYYTSQWFSNFYLNDLDHFIKEVLKVKYYVRYVDDMILFDNNKRKLHQFKGIIEEYLVMHDFDLRIKDNWQVFKIKPRGIDFVGYKITENETRLRKHIFIRLNRKVNKTKRKINYHNATSLISMIGWLKHTTYGQSYIDNKINNELRINDVKKYIGQVNKNEVLS